MTHFTHGVACRPRGAADRGEPTILSELSPVNRGNKANRDPFLRKSWHKTLVLERWRAEFVAQEFDFDAKAAS